MADEIVRSHEASALGGGHGLEPISHLEFGADILDMGANGLWAEKKAGGDLGCAQACADQAEDLEFAPGQAGIGSAGGGVRWRVEPDGLYHPTQRVYEGTESLAIVVGFQDVQEEGGRRVFTWRESEGGTGESLNLTTRDGPVHLQGRNRPPSRGELHGKAVAAAHRRPLRVTPPDHFVAGTAQDLLLREPKEVFGPSVPVHNTILGVDGAEGIAGLKGGVYGLGC